MNPISFTEHDPLEYDYSPEDEPPPPAYCYSLEYSVSLDSPAYGHRSVFGISHQVDEWIAGKTPYCYLNSCEEIYRLANTARRHRSKLTPLSSTRQAIDNAFYSCQLLRVVGVISLPTAIVHDIVKPPYHLTRMALALIQSKYERKKAENKILKEIIESLSLSLEAVLTMVVRLGLETREAVEQEIQDRGYYVYLTLARLLEAYGSRFAPSGTVYLATQKKLPKEHCSGIARLHFDQIHNLKDNLIFVDLFPAHSLTDASAVLERWLRRVLPALKESSVDRNEDDLSCHILQRLRKVRDELPGLLSLTLEK